MTSKKPKANNDWEAMEREYNTWVSILASFCQQLDEQLGRLLEDEGIALGFPIQKRVKEWTSIMKKFERLPGRFTDFKELQDLAGLRIILLFRRDVDRVSQLIAKYFKIVNQYDTQERLKEDQFGYSSLHFIVELPDGWLAVPTMARMAGLKAEVQIRTLAQHNWAEASQKLQYKQEANVPPIVKRAIYRVSALLETVDLEFERLLEERDSYRIDLEVSNTDENLNVDLLEKILDTLLPEMNKQKDGEDYSRLVDDLKYFGVTTARELQSLVEAHLEGALAIEAGMVEDRLRDLKEEGISQGTTPERTLSGVFYTHTGLTRAILEVAFGKKFQVYRNRYLTSKS